MEDIGELLFVLASSDRLRLLSEIKEENLRLTQLSQRLSASVQETVRHLARMSDAKLIEKDPNGKYGLTAYGREILELLPSFLFLSSNREYFLSHDLSPLPTEFSQRIGELSDCQFMQHLADVFAYADRVQKEAEEYVWYMYDRCPDTSYEFGHPEKISLRALGGELKPNLYQYCKATLGSRFEYKFMEPVRIGIVMSERGAIAFFPDLTGRIDYRYAFVGSSPDFHRWCYNLYSFYWDSPKKTLSSQNLAQPLRRYLVQEP